MAISPTGEAGTAHEQRTRIEPRPHPVAHLPFALETHRVRDLTIWRRKIRNVEFAVRTPNTSRPNPLVIDSSILASIWSPGAVYAAELGDGRPVWRRALPPFAHDSICVAGGMLYAHALHTLYALDPCSGEIAWSWRPARAGGGDLHGSPTIVGDRLFIGDETGRFWCLDARSGATLWCREPSPGQAMPINGTAGAFGRLVVIATNDDLVVAYEAETGREAWRQKLDAPSDSEPFRFKGHVALRTFWSVYLLRPKNGTVVQRWHWRARSIRHLVGTRDVLLAVTQKAYGGLPTAPSAAMLRASAAGDVDRILVGLGLDGEVYRHACPRYIVGLRWSSETGLVYESRADGLGILDPRTGERLHDIVSPGERHGAHGGPVDVRNGTIYMLTLEGMLLALRHPERSRASGPRSHANLSKTDRGT